MPTVFTPALDLILNVADRNAAGRLALSGSRVVAAPGISQQAARIVLGDTGHCRVRGVLPNLSGERAFDDVDLSVSTVRVALGIPGANPYCFAELSTPFPGPAAHVSTRQSATVDFPATKRITLDPAPYAGHLILTVDDLDPFEIPFDAEPDRILSFLRADSYKVAKRAGNAWEISGVEPGQDVAIAVDVTGLVVPLGVTGEIALNTDALATAFAAAATGTPPAEPKWLRVTLEVEIDGVKVYQDDRIEIAREIINLSNLVPVPLPPSDLATVNLALAGKQPIHPTLTLLAGLLTTPAGRSLLTKADEAAILAYISGQPRNDQLDALAALATHLYGRDFLTKSSSTAARAHLELDEVTNTSDANKPVSGPQQAAIDAVVDAITDALAEKAPLLSPAFGGIPTVPTAASETSNTQAASTAFVHALFAALIGAAPATVNAIHELAAAIGNDPNFAVTVANSIALKLSKSANLADLEDVAAARAVLEIEQTNNTPDDAKPVSGPQAAALELKADDAAVVHKTGAETIAGAKDFTGPASFHALASNSIIGTVLATPAAPVVTPIGNDEDGTWSYQIVALLSDGAHTAVGPIGTTANGEQTLDAENYNSLTWPAVPGAHSYDVYRVAAAFSPATLGRIANVPANEYDDTGAPGDGTAAPLTNNTGRIAGRIHDKGGQVWSVKAVGGTLDGVADDAEFFEAAVTAALVHGGKVFIAGPCKLGSKITISTPGRLAISGNGPSSAILWAHDDHLFEWTVEARDLLVSDLLICPRHAGNASHDAFHFGMGCANSDVDGLLTESDPPGGFKIGNILNFAGINAPGGVARKTDTLFVTNCVFYNFAKNAVTVGWGSRVIVFNTQCLGQDVAENGIYLAGDNGGVVIDVCDLLGCGNGLWVDEGNYIYGPEAAGFAAGRTPGTPILTNREVTIGVGVYTDSCKVGTRVSDGCKISCADVWASGCSEQGWLIEDGAPIVNLSGGQIVDSGSRGLTGGVAAAHGIEIRSGTFDISNIRFSNNRSAVPANDGIGLIVRVGVNMGTVKSCRFFSNYRGMQMEAVHFSASGNSFHDNFLPNLITPGSTEYHYEDNYFFSGGNEGETDGSPRKSFVATPAPQIGAFVLAAGTSRYKRRGKEIALSGFATISDKGTGDGYVRVPLPFPNVNPLYVTGSGGDSGVTGKPLEVNADGPNHIILRYSADALTGSPIVNGAVLQYDVSYEMG
jgi:Lower baseplate protein N-terminal domain